MGENFQWKENGMADHRNLLKTAMKRRRVRLSATQIIAIGFAAIILLGAGLLTLPAASRSGVSCGFFPALFTATSATCVTGLVLFDTYVQWSAFGQVVIITLIEIGGLGFITWEDIKSHGVHIRKYRMQSKVILTTTAILILVPAAYFFFFEFSGFSMKERILASFFQSVTPRTAGYNTVTLSAMTEVGQGILIALMLIGGSPGSTAGGMKTTTIAVLFANAIAVFKRKESPRFYGRRIADDAIKNAATIFLMYISLFFLGAMVISSIEAYPLLTCLYETASAIGTVGLTLGITPGLSVVSKLILITLMYFGRVGGLTLIFAAMPEKGANLSKLPQEKITVG